MQNLAWVPFALIAVTGMVSYSLVMKIIAQDINPFLFSALVNSGGVIINLLLLKFAPFARAIPITGSKFAMLMALACGFAVVCLDVGYFLMMRSNATGLTIGAPFVAVMNLGLSVLAGVLIFREHLLPQHYLGIIFAIIAVALLSYRQPI